jgi:S-adenosylmethionine decarboxylase
LEKSAVVKKFLVRAVREGGGTIVKAVFHNFNPYGVSGVVVITESHVTIHTWPEYGYAAVDIFSCSQKLKHRVIALELKRALGAGKVSQRTFRRGPVKSALF